MRGRSMRQCLARLGGSLLVAICPVAVVVSGSGSAGAADGTILRTITAQNYQCSVGTGIAFDGANLLLSCDYDNVITAISPTNGSFVRSYSIAGLGAIGALAWDRGRNVLWACGGFGGDDSIVYQINLDTKVATKAFGGTDGCPDGLAFDGTDDTLYLSADVATVVQHYKADGTLLADIPVGGKLGNCGNSGIAVGGSYLFLANDGCSQIYRAPKADVSSPGLFGTYPARLEDMECDDLTFRSSGKAAIWSKDAYDGILNAFELNVGDCGFGGQPSGSGDADTDGDGLPDSWETKGVDFNHDGKIDLDLPAMGADPKHKDIFIEVDWMSRPQTCIWFICWGGRSFAPQQAALADVRAAFAAAPVSNPDGTTGIRMHIDSGASSIMNPVTGATWGSASRSNQVVFKEILGSSDSNGYNWSDFDQIKNANFSLARRNVFHYVLYADEYQGSPTQSCPSGLCSSGISRGVPASDTILTDGHSSWGDGFTRIQERGTFMHEHGHNLNLRHGGGDDINFKPNYYSVMNYLFQLPGLPPNSRLDYSHGDPYNDWAHLVFTGGSVGAFGDVNLPVTTDGANELDPATAKAQGTYAADGDGTVHFVGPTLLFPGTGMRQLAVDITNVSAVGATYTVDVNAPGLTIATPPTPTQIASGATKRVNIAVDTSHLAPGNYPLEVRLSSALAGSDLSTDAGTITAPDLSDPSQLQQARDALSKLRALPASAGLDPATRQELIGDFIAALPWTASVALTGSPADAFTGTYTVVAPTFTPDPAMRRAISTTSWPGFASFALYLSRVQLTSADYKGSLQLVRPNGIALSAAVSVVWSNGQPQIQGAWTAKNGAGGSIKISLISP